MFGPYRAGTVIYFQARLLAPAPGSTFVELYDVENSSVLASCVIFNGQTGCSSFPTATLPGWPRVLAIRVHAPVTNPDRMMVVWQYEMADF
jgi:hypothetical protein